MWKYTANQETFWNITYSSTVPYTMCQLIQEDNLLIFPTLNFKVIYNWENMLWKSFTERLQALESRINLKDI